MRRPFPQVGRLIGVSAVFNHRIGAALQAAHAYSLPDLLMIRAEAAARRSGSDPHGSPAPSCGPLIYTCTIGLTVNRRYFFLLPPGSEKVAHI